MSKTKEGVENVSLPKNSKEYSYRGTEMITMTAQQFMHVYKATEIALEQAIERKFLSVPQWVSTVDGENVVTPTEEDVKNGLVRQTTSIEKTFDPQSSKNFQESFQAWVFPDVINAKQVLMQVHMDMIEAGVSRPITELQAELLLEQEAAQAEVANAEVIVPDMKVVSEKPNATEEMDETSMLEAKIDEAKPQK